MADLSASVTVAYSEARNGMNADDRYLVVINPGDGVHELMFRWPAVHPPDLPLRVSVAATVPDAAP